MNKTEKKTVKDYLGQVTSALAGCSWSLKKVFAADLRSKIKERFESKGITYENLCDEFGTPEEIAAGFYDREEYGSLLKKSKQLNVILAVSVVVLVAIIILLLLFINHLWTMVGNEISISPPAPGTYPTN